MGGGGRWTREERSMLVEMGARVRDARQEAGMTQDGVWMDYGIHRAYVGQVERGERNATTLVLVRLATVYGVDPGTFIAGFRHSPDLWPLEPRRPR